MNTLTAYIGNKTGIAYVTDHSEDGKPCCGSDPFSSEVRGYANDCNESFPTVKELDNTDQLFHGNGVYPEFAVRRERLIYKLAKIGIDFKELERNNNANEYFWQLHATTTAVSDVGK